VQDSRIIKAAGPVAAVVGMLALRACLYHATPPSDAAVTAVVRDVVIRERLAKEREGGTLEAQGALASQLPALREAKVEVVSVQTSAVAPAICYSSVAMDLCE